MREKDDDAAAGHRHDDVPRSEPPTKSSVGRFLRDNHGRILAEWERVVRTSIPVATQLDRSTLHNSIPELLLRIADLADEVGRTDAVEDRSGGIEPLPKEHAVQRLRSGYELRQVVAEYASLRKVVFDLWSKAATEPDVHALQLLNEAIDLAIVSAVVKFAHEAQRTATALDQLSSVATIARDMDSLLQGLLHVFVETEAAESAVLLLADAGELRARATVGPATDATRGASFEPGRGLVGEIVSQDRPSVVRAPHGSQEEVLRAPGTQTIYGVPLKSGHELFGVVVLGWTTERLASDIDVDLALLHQMAVRATALLVQRRLTDELMAANRRTNDFLAMLAHELRNPLAPIVAALALHRLPGASEAQRTRALDVVERQTRHLSRLVDDMLEVARFKRGHVRLERKALDARSVLAEAVEAARPLSERRKQTVTVSTPEEAIPVEADPTRLAQVLGNVLNNAVKYTLEGGTISASVAREGDQAVFRVRDTGAGIPASMLERIFDLFTQVDPSLDRSQGGLGLGLPIARMLTEMHGGRITAYSAGPGSGSEFIVRLPVMPDETTTRESEDAAAPPSRHARVLVVDDNADFVDTMSSYLASRGYVVATAGEGAGALERARTFCPEIVVLDIGLPRMDGYEVARRLRQEHGPTPVLIAVTGYGQEEDQRRSKEAGFDHHVTKPVDPPSLETLLVPRARQGSGVHFP